MEDRELNYKIRSVNESLDQCESLLFEESRDRDSYLERVNREQECVERIDRKLKSLKKRTKRMQFVGRAFTFLLSIFSIAFLGLLVKVYLTQDVSISQTTNPEREVGPRTKSSGVGKAF